MSFKTVVLTLLSIIVIITPSDIYAKEIQSIPEGSPIILEHSQDFQITRHAIITSNSNNGIDTPFYHYSHGSHYSHSSHYSHTSHSSHRSHYSSYY